MRIASDTVAAVTGAANGIGRAVALELARRNAQIALIDVDSDGLDTLVNRLRASSKHVCDVGNDQVVQTTSQAILAMHGKIHLLINCAGISVAGPVESLAIDDFEAAMRVNVWGHVHCCCAFLPSVHVAANEREGAVICNVLSVFALCAMPTKAAYAASKHAARAFTEALRHEVQATGSSVLAVHPGSTATDFVLLGRAVDESQRQTEARFLARGMQPKTTARKILRAIERERARTLIGYDTHIIDLAVRVAPRLFQTAVGAFQRYLPF